MEFYLFLLHFLFGLATGVISGVAFVMYLMRTGDLVDENEIVKSNK